MTRLRRVRALHLAPCTLHTYLIGCAASQRNNIATIHHTSAVNKTSGSFCHPRAPSRRSSRRALTLSPWSFHFFLLSIPLSLIPVPCSSPFLLSLYLSLFASYPRSIYLRRLFDPLFSFRLALSDRVFTGVAYLFDFFFPPVLFARPLCPVTLFCASHFLSSRPPACLLLSPSRPYIFSISLSAPFHVHPFSPLCRRSFLSLSRSLVSHVSARARATTPRRERGIRVMSSVD